MAKSLPPPINNLLSLSLPPDFSRSDENTLGYMLKQDTLTWENLVVGVLLLTNPGRVADLSPPSTSSRSICSRRHPTRTRCRHCRGSTSRCRLSRPTSRR